MSRSRLRFGKGGLFRTLKCLKRVRWALKSTILVVKETLRMLRRYGWGDRQFYCVSHVFSWG